MKPFSFVMEPTASYRRRSGVWIDTPHFGGDGIMTITCVEDKSYDIIQEIYGVEEIQADQPGCRSFLFVKLSDETQEQPYRVRVGGLPKCSCDAGRIGYRKSPSCKHRDALSRLIVCERLPKRELVGA